MGSVIPSRAPAEVGAMGAVDSCVKDISQGQGVSLEKEGRILSELGPLPPASLHQGLLLESSPPLNQLPHMVVLSPVFTVFISSFALLSPQVNSFLCTLIGSSVSNLLFLFRTFLLIFLSSLLTPNLMVLLFTLHFLLFLLLLPHGHFPTY